MKGGRPGFGFIVVYQRKPPVRPVVMIGSILVDMEEKGPKMGGRELVQTTEDKLPGKT